MMQAVDINKLQLPAAFKEYFFFKNRYAFLIGGAGAGKSEAAARKTILRALEGGRHLVIRKYATTLKQSVVHTILSILKSASISFDWRPSEKVLKLPSGGEIIFLGLDDPEKIKSIHNIASVWIEEASEIKKSEFIQIDLRLRGRSDFYKQITLTTNPVASATWILEVIREKAPEEVYKKVYTYKDNPFIDAEYKKTLENIKDPRFFKMYVLGEWGDFCDSLVFHNWQAVEVEDIDGGVYGLDFGYNNPTALVYAYERDGAFFVKEILYKTKITNAELIEFMKENVKRKTKIFCDSAEPNRIKELRLAGFDAVPASKEVEAGLAFLRESTLFLDGGNLIKEVKNYSYKVDKDGRPTEDVLKINDHAIDAMRYALFSQYKTGGRGKALKSALIAKKLNAGSI